MRPLVLSLSALGLIACTSRGEDVAAQSGSIARSESRTRAETPILAPGTNHTCTIARRGARCWGRNAFGQATPPVLKNPRQIASGASHSCAVDDEGVKCWGLDSERQATVPTTLVHPRQVTAGDGHTCAVDDVGVTCWGNNAFNQATVPALRNPREVVAGSQHTCALDDDGVKCWGSNTSKQTVVPALRNPRRLFTGTSHTCALDDDGVKCWGNNTSAQSTVPATLLAPIQLGGGTSHSCALDATGITCWGRGSSGQTEVPPLRYPTDLGVGRTHTCAVDEDGAKCWGLDLNGQSKPPADLELVARHGCLLVDGAVRCAGDNEHGQVGIGSDADHVVAISQTAPVDLGRAFGTVTRARLGRAFGCALGASGQVKCWGTNGFGQLGLGDTRARGILPTDLGDALPALALSPSAALDAGRHHACAVSRDGEIACWGEGRSGQLGTESGDDVGTVSGPTRAHLPADVRFRDVALGVGHSCGLTTSGAVYCFGANDRGQLGRGRPGAIGDRPGSMSDARAVDLGFAVKMLASGDRHVCALSTEGLVKCWGANANGELGLGDTRDRGTSADDLGASLPAVDLGRGQVAAELRCGARHCCVRTVQNTLKCWGDNNEGQLGLGDVHARGKEPSSMGNDLPFVLTPPREKVLAIDLEDERTCARMESGLRCWGRNRSGELGYGDRTPRGSTQSTVPRLLPAL